jgi:hypothetical protein
MRSVGPMPLGILTIRGTHATERDGARWHASRVLGPGEPVEGSLVSAEGLHELGGARVANRAIKLG